MKLKKEVVEIRGIEKSFIRFLIDYRDEFDLSREELGQKLGLTANDVKDIEEGKVELDLLFVQDTLRKLGMKIEISADPDLQPKIPTLEVEYMHGDANVFEEEEYEFKTKADLLFAKALVETVDSYYSDKTVTPDDLAYTLSNLLDIEDDEDEEQLISEDTIIEFIKKHNEFADDSDYDRGLKHAISNLDRLEMDFLRSNISNGGWGYASIKSYSDNLGDFSMTKEEFLRDFTYLTEEEYF